MATQTSFLLLQIPSPLPLIVFSLVIIKAFPFYPIDCAFISFRLSIFRRETDDQCSLSSGALSNKPKPEYENKIGSAVRMRIGSLMYDQGPRSTNPYLKQCPGHQTPEAPTYSGFPPAADSHRVAHSDLAAYISILSDV